MNRNGNPVREAEILLRIVDEESPAPETLPDEGSFIDEIETLQEIREIRGTDAAREALAGMMNSDDELAALVSGGNQETSGWTRCGLDDAFQPLPPLEYLTGKKVIPVPSLSMFYGYPGSYKSMLAQYLCVRVAIGADVFPNEKNRSHETKQRPSLYLDQENGRRRLSRRLRALTAPLDVDPGHVPLHFISYPEPAFHAADLDSASRLREQVKETGARLVVVDNLATASGDADENSKEMAPVMDGLRRLSEQTGAAVLVVHHQTKAETSRAGNALRGHSSIDAALDLAVQIKRDKDQPKIKLQSTKERDGSIVPFELQFGFEQKPDGSLKTAHFKDIGPVESEGQKRRRKAREMILEHHEDGMNQSQIITAVQENESEAPGQHTITDALTELAREGELEERRGQRGAKEFYRDSSF